MYEVDRIDFAEAYLIACAESTGIGKIVSFDRSLDRVQSVVRIEPPIGRLDSPQAAAE